MKMSLATGHFCNEGQGKHLSVWKLFSLDMTRSTGCRGFSCQQVGSSGGKIHFMIHTSVETALSHLITGNCLLSDTGGE